MYKIVKIPTTEADLGRRLAETGHHYEGLDYIREHTEVLEEFDTLLEARQCWRALGLNPGANYHVTGEMLYRLDVVRTD